MALYILKLVGGDGRGHGCMGRVCVTVGGWMGSGSVLPWTRLSRTHTLSISTDASTGICRLATEERRGTLLLTGAATCGSGGQGSEQGGFPQELGVTGAIRDHMARKQSTEYLG